MRLLHTSDWHLGRQFHGASLLQEQAAALDRIVALAAEAEVDAVLIAGDLYDRAIPPADAVLVAHTFVAGGNPSESERDLSVGNVERVSVGAFAGFHYVALGHLHGAQELDGPRLAYSGTPLPYSFSEEGQRKSVRLVDLADDGSVQVEVVPLGLPWVEGKAGAGLGLWHVEAKVGGPRCCLCRRLGCRLS